MPQLRSEWGRSVGVAAWAPDHDGGESALADACVRLKPGPGRSAAEVASHQLARVNRAIVEIVAERGYKRTTIREIARVAGISTRAFYQHYSTKEECFLWTHRLVAQRLLRQVGEAEIGASPGAARLAAAVSAVVEGWSQDPRLASFLLLAPPEVGPAALEQGRLASSALAAQLSVGFTGDATAERARLAHLLSAGILAGLSSVARALFLDGRAADLLELRDELVRWASTCWTCSVTEFEALEVAGMRAERWNERLQGSPSDEYEQEYWAASSSSDAALFHSAVLRLVASADKDSLTVRGICAAAGVPRTCFVTNFASLEDCLAVVGEAHVRTALDRASRFAKTVPPGAVRVQQGLVSLCNQIAHDPALAELCFGELVSSGEWFARRERQLVEGLAELLDDDGPISGSKERPVAVDASIGAALGLIGHEIASGSPGSICRRSPAIGYLMLAPSLGASEAVSLVCEESGPAALARAS